LNAQVENIGKVDLEVSDFGPPGIGAWTVDVHYDTDVLVALTCGGGPGGSICNHDYGAGVVRSVGTDIYGFEGDGALASIGFGCKAAGVSALEVTVDVLVDATPGEPAPIEAKLLNSAATCSEDPLPTAADPTPTGTPPGGNIKVAGDANCDGNVNSIDASLVLQLVAGMIDSVACDDADYNHDETIDAVDAALILQKDAGLIH
jgi:hypothetical protein